MGLTSSRIYEVEISKEHIRLLDYDRLIYHNQDIEEPQVLFFDDAIKKECFDILTMVKDSNNSTVIGFNKGTLYHIQDPLDNSHLYLSPKISSTSTYFVLKSDYL